MKKIIVILALIAINHISLYAMDAPPQLSQEPSKSSDMNFVAHTANILGIFNDPFEFDGNYGNELNAARSKVFSLIMPENIESYGPTLSQIVTPQITSLLIDAGQALGVSQEDIESILGFCKKYGEQKLFKFLRNSPSDFLKLDKTLKDVAARKGKDFDLPILGSIGQLKGSTSEELKENLFKALFTPEVLSLTKPKDALIKMVNGLDQNYLKSFFNDNADNKDLYAFCSPIGQIFFFWLYQATNLQLVSKDSTLINQINQLKQDFAKTLGNAQKRAETFRNKIIESNSKVVFTQEADNNVIKALTRDNLFLPVDKQNNKDGTLVFLRNDFWEPDYKVIPIEDYLDYKDGRINAILATQKTSGQKFLLASAHGHSTKPEDGRMQISKILEKVNQLSKEQKSDIKLLIGTDANTKSKEDVRLLKELLKKSNLTSTEVGPTTIKRRMLTTQHGKAGKWAIDEEDYLIVMTNQAKLENATVGFSKTAVDTTKALPNIQNQSDHYSVGALVSLRD